MNPETLEKLTRFMNAIDGKVLSPEDFEKSFTAVMDVVERMLRKQIEVNEKLEQRVNELTRILTNKTDTSLSELKSQVNTLFVEGRLKDMSAEQKKLFASLKNNVSSLFGEKMNEMHKEVMGTLETKTSETHKEMMKKQGPPGRPPTAQEIQIAATPMFEELKKEVERLKDTRSNRAMGRVKVPGIERVNLSNQLNGQAREFELPRDTVDILGVWGTSFPLNFNPTDGDRADWDLVGNKLVLRDGVPAPEAEHTLWVLVKTLFL